MFDTKYCIVGLRPVKGIRNIDGNLGVYSFDWETGFFEQDSSYFDRIYFGDIESGEVVEITKDEFEVYVERLKKEKGLK